VKKISLLICLLCAACADKNPPAPASQQSSANNADVTLVVNATVHTADSANSQVEAFAYRDQKIVAVGKTESLENTYQGARRIDANGATVVPGFIDAHGHLLGLGQSLMIADLMGTTSKEEILAVLKQHELSLKDGQWLLGRGWDQNDWEVQELPSAADLNAAFPNRPVWLERVDGHAGWANQSAIASSKQDLSGSWQPDGGEIVRNSAGQATGVFIDNAVGLINDQVPTTTKNELNQALKLAMQKTASVGLTGMHDAGTTLETWQLLETLKQNDELNIRVYAMANGANKMLAYLCDNGVVTDPEAYLTARSVKLYSDGALGSRGAALIADYSDAPGNVGLLIESEEKLKQHTARASACGLQVNIHAIGDRGNRVTLNVLDKAVNDDNPGRHRIEHSQVVELDDFERFKDLGLIASVQPTHATSDMYWAEERVGEERIKGAYAWQKFIELGVPLALGSDFPVEKPDPLLGFYAAVTRQDAKGWPDKGWYPNQVLTREQALHGFTLGAAYAAFQEDQVGSISVGKAADFVMLSKDIMSIPAEEILTTQVLKTVIAGKEVFSTE